VNPARRRVLLGMVLGAVLAVSSCASPKILQFGADPQRICQDQTMAVSWSVKGAPVLAAEPPVAGLGAVAPEGSLNLSLDETTVFTLHVTRNGKTAFARQEVVVYQTDAVIPIVIATEPDDGGGLVAMTTAPARDWDAALRIATVSNASDRAVAIEHGGRTVDLAAGATTSELADLAVSGDWALRAGLLPGEIIGDPAHAPAEMLRLQVTLTCGE
jgi:hypothetical protein